MNTLLLAIETSAGAQYAPAILHVQIANILLHFVPRVFIIFLTNQPTDRNEVPCRSLKSDSQSCDYVFNSSDQLPNSVRGRSYIARYKMSLSQTPSLPLAVVLR